MDASSIILQRIVRELPPQQLEEVIHFAEFLSLKAKKDNGRILEKPPFSKQLNLPVIKEVKFSGDPLLRREDLYDE